MGDCLKLKLLCFSKYKKGCIKDMVKLTTKAANIFKDQGGKSCLS